VKILIAIGVGFIIWDIGKAVYRVLVKWGGW